ncbi:MAG: glycoside hydrolase family 19 protein [Pseudomonadota bacterium]
MISADDIILIMPNCPRERAERYVDAINDAMHEFAINTPQRQAAFLAQVAHETNELMWMRERWGPTPAQQRYEGRIDLGNTQPGDGKRYMGRGMIQITGRANYSICSEALFGDARFLLDHPEKLEEAVPAARSAGWFWQQHGCNELADAGEFGHITRRINGGVNGYPQRLSFYKSAQEVLT